jgi:hypothetical protein
VGAGLIMGASCAGLAIDVFSRSLSCLGCLISIGRSGFRPDHTADPRAREGVAAVCWVLYGPLSRVANKAARSYIEGGLQEWGVLLSYSEWGVLLSYSRTSFAGTVQRATLVQATALWTSTLVPPSLDKYQQPTTHSPLADTRRSVGLVVCEDLGQHLRRRASILDRVEKQLQRHHSSLTTSPAEYHLRVAYLPVPLLPLKHRGPTFPHSTSHPALQGLEHDCQSLHTSPKVACRPQKSYRYLSRCRPWERAHTRRCG